METFLQLLCSTLDAPLFSKSQMTVLFDRLQKGGELVQIWCECLACESHLLYLGYCFWSDSKAFKESLQIDGWHNWDLSAVATTTQKQKLRHILLKEGQTKNNVRCFHTTIITTIIINKIIMKICSKITETIFAWKHNCWEGLLKSEKHFG